MSLFKLRQFRILFKIFPYRRLVFITQVDFPTVSNFDKGFYKYGEREV